MSRPGRDRKIDYIEFSVTDVAAAKSFYSEVFGWKFQDYGPDYSSFDDGSLQGGISKVNQVRMGGPLVVVYALELETIQQCILDNGGVIVRETFEFPGGRRFHFRDPSGNELAVWSDQPTV